MQQFQKKIFLITVCASLIVSPLFSFSTDDFINSIYESIDYGEFEKPDFLVFERGLNGYYKLDHSNRLSDKEILAIVDFRKSGNEKRLWIIDLKNKRVLHHSLVAHGKNSGEVYAEKFSNIHNSNQSSLGFYITGGTYMGKHGVSLKLYGVEKEINDNAESRAIVMHGADYVSYSFINKVGRLGRSFGCPAIPMDNYKEIINLLKDGTCLFIYYPDKEYLSKTSFGV
jgi:hypothetical protein